MDPEIRATLKRMEPDIDQLRYQHSVMFHWEGEDLVGLRFRAAKIQEYAQKISEGADRLHSRLSLLMQSVTSSTDQTK